MLARLRVNFGYKALALICACLLHWYATTEQNPRQTRDINVRLVSRNVPAGALVDSASLPLITVTVDGSPDDISRLTDNSITASVDLGHGVIGQSAKLAVQADVALTLRNQITIEDIQPRTVPIELKPRKKRRLPVAVDYPKALPAGYSYHIPTVVPREATVSGAEDTVNLVAQLLVQVDSDSAGTPVDEDFAIHALDAHGNPITDVAVTPATAHVQIGIVKVPAMKALLVSANVIGDVPFAYKVDNVKVVPTMVTVAGRPDQLTQIGTISTEPIDINGAISDQTRQVNCVLSPGLSLPVPQSITVKVHIVPRPTGPPAPSPAAPKPTAAGPATGPPAPTSAPPGHVP